jgi:hypothetical protein
MNEETVYSNWFLQGLTKRQRTLPSIRSGWEDSLLTLIPAGVERMTECFTILAEVDKEKLYSHDSCRGWQKDSVLCNSSSRGGWEESLLTLILAGVDIKTEYFIILAEVDIDIVFHPDYCWGWWKVAFSFDPWHELGALLPNLAELNEEWLRFTYPDSCRGWWDTRQSAARNRGPRIQAYRCTNSRSLGDKEYR